MSFPPEFSSTLTYENRYDLDEIDVFIEGDSNNPMYFQITGMPQALSYGKHYFYLSILDPNNQEYQLRPESRILFEFKSINNVILMSDVSYVNQSNGFAVCFVELLRDPLRTFEEPGDGEGKLTIVGSLENKLDTINTIPPKFENAMNYRCTFPIQVGKNLAGADSPIITNVGHNFTTIPGQFSFVKASISPSKNPVVV